ncbi:MAG: RdgB/HAM1 family non-canonical purine NTP pyrophosphatase [Chitinispirillaceae bacterium]
MKEFIIATGNEGKLKEFREMLSRFPVRLSSLRDHWQPVPQIEENGATFFDNAKIKADWVYEHSKGVWALADDSGLEVDALDGRPGVKSARYSGENATSDKNNAKLLSELADVPSHLRTARFRCVLVARIGPEEYISAEGSCEGRIASSRSGSGGFGYDPLFVPSGYSESFAELSSEVKNRISHRGAALRALSRKLYGTFDRQQV